MESLGSNNSCKTSAGGMSPYSPGASTLQPGAPSPSSSHHGGSRLPSPAHPPPHHLATPPPAHIGSYSSLSNYDSLFYVSHRPSQRETSCPLAHMYTAAFSHMAAASLGGYLSALARRPEPEAPTPPAQPQSALWPPDLGHRSPSPPSEDSKEGILSAPLHLVTEEASRRRREEEAEERRREEQRRPRSRSPQSQSPYRHSPVQRLRSPIRPRSPIPSPPPLSPLTPPPVREHRPPPSSISVSASPTSSNVGNKSGVGKVRSGPKPKPSPLSIEAITGSPPVLSPRQFSASSLNTPLVNLPSPPYSGVGTKSPYLPLHLWSSLSPLASLSPHYGSPRNQHHFTFPALPQYSPLPPPVVSPLLPGTAFDFSALTSPSERTASASVPVQQ